VDDIRIFIKECKSLAQGGLETSIIAFDEKAYKDVKDGVTRIVLCVPVKNRLQRMLKRAQYIYRNAIAVNAEVYHFHDPEIFWLAIPLKWHGKKIVYDLHEDLPDQIMSKPYLSKFNRRVLRWLAVIYEYCLLPKADLVITATPFIRKRKLRFNKKTYCVSNYPIQSEFNIERLRTAIHTAERSVCYTGALSSIRGVSVLLESVLNFNDDWLLHLAGPITDNHIKTKLEAALKVTDRIIYWGILPRAELKSIFERSSAGIVTFLPEPNHINAVPNKMYEYMSSGLPIICSSFKDWDEMVTDYQIGITVDPANAQDIRNKINFIFANPVIASSWGENGAEAVRKKFNWQTESQKLVELYLNI